MLMEQVMELVSFLNVHEGPQSISKFNKIKIKEGMILSNEPGYYRKGNSYGIQD